MSTGAGTAQGIALESAWGTAVSRTNWRPVVRSDVQWQRQRYNAGRIGTWFFAKDVEGQKVAAATTVLEGTYENIGLWLQAALFSTVATTGSGPYTHTYDQGTALPVGYTLEEIRGDTTKSRLMSGALVSSWELAISQSSPLLLLTINWLGKSVTRPSAGTASFGSGDELVSFTDAGALSWDSTDFCVSSLRIRGSNALAARYCLGSGGLTEKPVKTANSTVEIEASGYYDNALDTKYDADTEANMTLAFTGTGNNAMTLTLNKVLFATNESPTNGQGPIMHTLRGRAREDTSGNVPFSVEIVNDNSSGTAN